MEVAAMAATTSSQVTSPVRNSTNPASTSPRQSAVSLRTTSSLSSSSKGVQTPKLIGNWKPQGSTKLYGNSFSCSSKKNKMAVKADSSIQEEQVKTGQPGSQKGQSVPSQMVNGNERSQEDSSKAWKEEITRMPPFFSQPKVFRDVGKSVLLEVKKEGESKVVPKKRGRGPTKSKGGEKEAKKSKKFEEKACFEEGEKDDNDESLHWKDEEVETLIAVRGELAQEFSKAAKKQGQNAWLKVEARMAASIRGCSRTAIACKKKYGGILTQYRNDKRHDEVSGNDRHEHSKWFEQMDLWNGTRASVSNQIPASAQESIQESPTPEKSVQIGEKKTKADRLEGFLESVVKNSTDMIESFKSTSTLLSMMEAHMAALVNKF